MLPERLSNGDENRVSLNLVNNYPFVAHLSLIEELPFQFQKRDFIFYQINRCIVSYVEVLKQR